MHRRPRHKRLCNSIRRARWKEQHALVVELSHEYLAVHPHDASVWLCLGHALIGLSRYEEAEHALSVELDAGFESLQPLFWRERGELERRRGNLREARQWFEHSLEADPNDSLLPVELGYIAFKLGELEVAESYFRAALEDGNFESKGADFYRLAEVLRAQNRIEEALDCFRQAAVLNPKSRIISAPIHELEQVLLLRLMSESKF